MSDVRGKLAAGGRLVIPAEYRRALGIKVGDEVVLRLSSHEVRVMPLRDAIRRAQKIVRRHVKKGESLSEELLRERRAEARRE